MPAKRPSRSRTPRPTGRTTPKGTRPPGSTGHRHDTTRPAPSLRSAIRSQGHQHLDTSAKGLSKSPRAGHQGGSR